MDHVNGCFSNIWDDTFFHKIHGIYDKNNKQKHNNNSLCIFHIFMESKDGKERKIFFKVCILLIIKIMKSIKAWQQLEK